MAHNTHTCDIQLSCYITGCDVAQSHNHLGRSADDGRRPLDPHLRTMNELGGGGQQSKDGGGKDERGIEGGRGCCIHDPDNNNHLLSATRGASERAAGRLDRRQSMAVSPSASVVGDEISSISGVRFDKAERGRGRPPPARCAVLRNEAANRSVIRLRHVCLSPLPSSGNGSELLTSHCSRVCGGSRSARPNISLTSDTTGSPDGVKGGEGGPFKKCRLPPQSPS